ncbi:MAG TPA: hypothetical protein VF698_05300 [Thermoanaerobaculia bacterium]|jgi:hypothetical protein
MDQDNPNNPGSPSGTGYGTGGSNYGAAGTGSTGTTAGSTGSGAGSTGGAGSSYGSSPSGSPINLSDSGAKSGGGAEADLCPHCGQSTRSGGLEAFLGRLGITDEMIGNLKGQWDNVNIDEYLNTARDYLKDGSGKATKYAKENPGKVAAGVAVLAIGAGLIYNAVRDKGGVDIEFTPDYDTTRDRNDPNQPR